MEQLFHGSRYGEITNKGTKKLIQTFKTYFSKPHIFYDLGSGKGDLSINIAIPKNVSHKIWDKIPKGCLFICGRRIKNSETRKKYKWTEPIEKKCISNEKWIYFSKSQKYIIKEE